MEKKKPHNFVWYRTNKFSSSTKQSSHVYFLIKTGEIFILSVFVFVYVIRSAADVDCLSFSSGYPASVSWLRLPSRCCRRLPRSARLRLQHVDPPTRPSPPPLFPTHIHPPWTTLLLWVSTGWLVAYSLLKFRWAFISQWGSTWIHRNCNRNFVSSFSTPTLEGWHQVCRTPPPLYFPLRHYNCITDLHGMKSPLSSLEVLAYWR